MFESVSIGDLAVAVLGTGSDAVTRGLAGKDVKKAYNALRKHACIMAPNEVPYLELLPHSVARRGVLGYILDGNPKEYDDELRILVRALITQLKMESPVAGVDLSYILLLEAHFDKPKPVVQAKASKSRVRKGKNSAQEKSVTASKWVCALPAYKPSASQSL